MKESNSEKELSEEPAVQISSADSNLGVKAKNNRWVISTVILAIVCLVLVAVIFGFGSPTGNAISQTDAGTKITDFLNGRVGGGVTFVSAEDMGNLYKVTVSYKGEDVPVYVSKDGQYFIQGLMPLTEQAGANQSQEQEQPKDVPKSDKPKVEAFVFSYCPYGLQFEKALLPIYKLLKNKADINVVAIGAMHGEYEKQESLRQLCIQKIYGKDKLWQYLEKFMGDTAIGDCGNKQECSVPLVEKIFTQAGINKATINTCMQKDAEALYNKDIARANELGVSGSPTFIVNGAQVQVSRSSDAIMKAVCSGFITVPEECKQIVSTEAALPGFGYGENPSVSNTHASGSC